MLDRQILNYLYGSYPAALVMTCLLSLMLWLIVSSGSDALSLLFWLLGMIAVLGIRGADYFYTRNKIHDRQYPPAPMFLRFRAGVAVTGLVWGIIPLLIFNDGTELDHLYAAFVLAGVNAGATTSLGVDRVSVLCYMLCSLVPLIISFLLRASLEYLTMSLMTGMFIIYLYLSAKRYRNQMLDNITLRSAVSMKEKSLKNWQGILELMIKLQSLSVDRNLAPADIYSKVLDDLSTITRSDLCFIGQVVKQGRYHGFRLLSASHHLGKNGRNLNGGSQDQDIFRGTVLGDLLQEVLGKQYPVTRNLPDTGGTDSTVKGFNVRKFSGFPVVYNNRTIAILGLVNAGNELDAGMASAIAPLLNTLGQTMADSLRDSQDVTPDTNAELDADDT